MLEPFAQHATDASAELDTLLLSLSQEFDWVDPRQTHAALDLFALELREGLAPGADCVAQAEALSRVLGRHGFQVSQKAHPLDALLHSVIARRQGHPILLAAICAEIGRRAGLDTRPVRSGDAVLVGIEENGRAVVIDPSGACVCRPHAVSWMCPHEVTFAALSELVRLLAMHGRVETAMRASTLRSELPMGDCVRQRIEFEHGALQATLN